MTMDADTVSATLQAPRMAVAGGCIAVGQGHGVIGVATVALGLMAIVAAR
jgi:hypothetical protein